MPFQASAQPRAAPAPPEDPRECHGGSSLLWEGHGASLVPGGVPGKPGGVLAALQHREEGKGQCLAGELSAGGAPRVRSCLQALVEEGETEHTQSSA